MRNLKVRYRKSFFGMLWTVLVPAGSTLIYFAVFHFVLKVRMENYLLYILTGLIPWSFFATTLSIGLEVIVGNFGLLNKVPLPPHSLVLAEAVTNMLNFLLSLPVLLVVILLTGAAPSWAILQTVPLTACLFLITYSFALLLGLSYVYFRDLRYLTGLVLQFWFYLTPIMYSPEMIPPEYKYYTRLNPVFEIFDGFHKAIVSQEWVSIDGWAQILIWTFAVYLVASVTLRKIHNRIVEIL